jgi:hypothetical protein
MNEVVRCHSGFRYADKPLSFQWDMDVKNITGIISEWKTESGYTFVVITDMNYIFELQYNDSIDLWSVKPSNQ